MTTESAKPTLLILSFSPLASDARVLKQIELFRDRYAVTTCGIGEFDREGVDHIRIPDGLAARELEGKLITLRQYRAAYWRIPAVRWAAKALRGRRFDIILANDVEAVPVAVRLRPTFGVHADLHEYTPRLHEQNEAWMRLIKPFWDWVCRRYVSRASSWSTVSGGLARQYEIDFGFAPEVVTNATPYRDVAPSPVHSPIRLVHSGVCLRNRDLLETIRGVQGSAANCTLDLYLMPNDPVHLEELRAAAEEVPGRVRIMEPVPYNELVTVLQDYDVGIFVLPPNSFSHEWALPNKLFDFVQARLGVVVGPSPEMADYVRRYRLGLVTDGFEVADISRTLDGLTAAAVADFKQAANDSAENLGAEVQVQIWAQLVAGLIHEEDHV
ncbi:glycosyltransferase family 1 protein [Microbacterium sp. NPDC055357]